MRRHRGGCDERGVGDQSLNGAWIARSDDRRTWALEGPFLKGWQVNTLGVAPDESYLLSAGSTWYGAALHRNPDLASWDQVVNEDPNGFENPLMLPTRNAPTTTTAAMTRPPMRLDAVVSLGTGLLTSSAPLGPATVPTVPQKALEHRPAKPIDRDLGAVVLCNAR
jgi:hypothetical protein